MADIMDLFAGMTLVGANNDGVAPNIQMSSGDDQALLEEYYHLRTQVYAQYLRTMVDDEKYYRLEFGADLIPQEWVQRGFEPTLPPTAYNAVESATNHILTTPDILVPERPTSEDNYIEQSIAAVKGSALLFFWHQIFKQGDPLGHAKKDLIKWGKIVLKKTCDFDVLSPDGIEIGRGEFPWRIVQLSPSQVFEDPTNPYDPAFVYEAYETTRAEAIRTFPDASGAWKTSGKRYDKVRVVEYWEKPRESSKGRRVIWIEDERVLNKPNPYHWVDGITDSGKETYNGYLPYFIADSAWGDGDIGAAPHERYVGLIRRIHSLLKTEARQLTAADAQLRIGTFPLLKMVNIDEDDEHPLRLGPGAKIHLDETQDVSAIAWPQLDPALFNIITQVHRYANELAQFQTLSGIPQTGVDSATEADQNFRSASAKLGGPLNALKSIITRINETVLQDVELIFESPVTVYGAADGAPGVVTLLPEWISGFYENFVELKTSDQKALDAANAVRWANLYQTFGLDKRFAMKMAGIPNPQQRIAQRMQEDVWLDPRMHEIRVAQAMRNQGGDLGEILSMNVINQMLNGGVPTDEQPEEQENATSEPMMAGVGGEPTGGEPGSFPMMPGMPSNRNPNPNQQGLGEPPPPQRNMARAIGFNRATLLNPARSLSG